MGKRFSWNNWKLKWSPKICEIWVQLSALGLPTGQVFASFLKQSCTVSFCWCMVFSATAWFRLTFFCGLLPMSHAGLFLMENDWRALQPSALKDQQYLKANPKIPWPSAGMEACQFSFQVRHLHGAKKWKQVTGFAHYGVRVWALGLVICRTQTFALQTKKKKKGTKILCVIWKQLPFLIYSCPDGSHLTTVVLFLTSKVKMHSFIAFHCFITYT